MTYTALVLAAQRAGVTDPLAEKCGVSHKCLIDMDGTPMIERVLTSLRGSKHVDKILISIDDPSALDGLEGLQKDVQSGAIELIQSAHNLAESVAVALDGVDAYPVIICTADNALQTAEMIDHFCSEFSESKADAGVSMTPAELIWSKYPDGQRRPYRFKDGKYSNCNLYAIRSRDCLIAAKPFRSGGQFAKSAKRILQAFGLVNMVLYKYGFLTLHNAYARVSKRLGIVIKPIILPFAEAPIDVDNERTEKIALRILKERRLEAAE